MTRYVGVDLGVRQAAFVSEDGEICQVLKVLKINDMAVEIRDLGALIANFSVNSTTIHDLFFMETPVLAGIKNLQTLIRMGMAAGAAIYGLYGHTVELIPVSSWKKATVGRGNADKQEVSEWLKRTQRSLYDRTQGDQNLIDAACIALSGRALAEAGGMRREGPK